MKRATVVAVTSLSLLLAGILIGPGCSNDKTTGPDTGLSPAAHQSAVDYVDFSDGYPFGVWQDGFESYAVGTWPSTWIPSGNAPDANNCISNAVAYDGQQSLRLYGVPFGAWAGCAYRALQVAPPYEIKVAVYNGNEPIGGTVQPARGHIGILAGTHWSAPWRTLLLFNQFDKIISSGGNELGTYTTLQWYTVRIRYERPYADSVALRYWIDNKCVGAETLPIRASEDNMVTLTFEALEGSAWFDAVEVTSRP